LHNFILLQLPFPVKLAPGSILIRPLTFFIGTAHMPKDSPELARVCGQSPYLTRKVIQLLKN